MIIAVWILSGLLALAYLAAGGLKIVTPHEKLKVQQSWAEDVAPPLVKVIGVLEVLGAIGLILPPLLHIVPILAPIAATGLALLQIVAITLHIRRHDDPKRLVANIVLFVLAVFVAVVRFAGLA